RKMNRSGGTSGNPLGGLGRVLGQQAKLEASRLAVQHLTKDLQNTKQELQDMKTYAGEARVLLDEIYAHGPVLREQNQKISGVLTDLAAVAKESLETRAGTDKEVEKFLTAQDTATKNLVASNKIAVFAE
ncbi:MAG: hypothetical protein H7Y43_10885, partial [Akkermansiaceae bacterium]|nr:hypothetical protein [Verrucomicrobiales bacterium]